MNNGNQPAYPTPLAGRNDGGIYHTMEKDYQLGGLTKREYFAAMAMQGLLANSETINRALATINEKHIEGGLKFLVASLAKSYADELLKQLES